MGASESCPQTPTCKPLLNKHLAQVCDPRSPTAGILRTPIEIESSPQGTPLCPLNGDGLAVNSQDMTWDPRSPTPGISRTPMKDVVTDTINCPVKQLREIFMAEKEEKLLLEESCHQDQKPNNASVLEIALEEQLSPPEASQESSVWVEEEKEQITPSTSIAVATRPTHLAGVLHSTGSKPARRRANSKILTMSTNAGRSPLSVLKDDNSPNSLASLQGKRYLTMADSQGDCKEFSSGRSLKAISWQSLNKENRQRPLVEN